MIISPCEIRPEGGPPLDRFTLHRTEQGKWSISDHENEECAVLATALSKSDGRRGNERG
jgi:hypothetical protein